MHSAVVRMLRNSINKDSQFAHLINKTVKMIATFSHIWKKEDYYPFLHILRKHRENRIYKIKSTLQFFNVMSESLLQPLLCTAPSRHKVLLPRNKITEFTQ